MDANLFFTVFSDVFGFCVVFGLTGALCRWTIKLLSRI